LKVSEEVIEVFKKYEWPGNVRELLHVLEYCFNTMTDSIIEVNHLPKYLKSDNNAKIRVPSQIKTLEYMMEQYEREVIENTMKRNNNNVTRAAEELGIMRQSLQYRIKKHKL
jgi:arginine utilization regulatory protein